jgi:nicotinate-nucleotide adenylyltransferase
MPHLLLYGGTFDPIHNGHLITCRRARELLGAQMVVLIPARISPFKTGTPQAATPGASARTPDSASPQDRLSMLQLAIEGESGYRVDPRELDREGPSYTIDTVRAIAADGAQKATSPETEPCRLTLLLGSDQLPQFHAWRNVHDLLKICDVAVMPRQRAGDEAGMHAIAEAVRSLEQKLAAPQRIQALQTPMIDISATEIRARVKMGKSIKYLVPERVEAYIAGNLLYRPPAKS